jgi:hypothetical protein
MIWPRVAFESEVKMFPRVAIYLRQDVYLISG